MEARQIRKGLQWSGPFKRLSCRAAPTKKFVGAIADVHDKYSLINGLSLSYTVFTRRAQRQKPFGPIETMRSGK